MPLSPTPKVQTTTRNKKALSRFQAPRCFMTGHAATPTRLIKAWFSENDGSSLPQAPRPRYPPRRTLCLSKGVQRLSHDNINARLPPDCHQRLATNPLHCRYSLNAHCPLMVCHDWWHTTACGPSHQQVKYLALDGLAFTTRTSSLSLASSARAQSSSIGYPHTLSNEALPTRKH